MAEGNGNAIILKDTLMLPESIVTGANEGDAEDAEGEVESIVVEIAEGAEIPGSDEAPGGVEAAEDSDVVEVVQSVDDSEATDVVEAVEAEQ